MGIIEKKYTYEKGTDNLYNIDTYNTDPTKKALEISDTNNVRFRNLSDNRNTDNFYGDGRLGSFDKRDTAPVVIRCAYFYEVKEHPTHGWCIWKQWHNTTGNFQVNDEVILYKKHIEKEEYLPELGDWELVTIKEIVNDADGVHYIIDRAPTYEWTTRTLNSVTLVQQFTVLNVFEGNNYREEITAYSYISTPLGLWDVGRVRVSLPNGIVYIKANEEIIIGKNAYIGARYGYNGAHAYGNYYTRYSYCDASGPRGGGAFDAASELTTNLRDIRSPGCGRPSLSYVSSVHGGVIATHVNYAHIGGFVDGRNGINHTENTLFSNNYGINSVDLNRKLYYGIGTTTFQFANNYTYSGGDWHSNHAYGRSGGGILVIQTPKLTFVDKNSKLFAGDSSMDSRLWTGFGGGGSMLIKVEEFIFNENPNQLQTYNNKTISSDVDYTNISYNFGTTLLDGTRNHLISNPGLIQIDFDRWKTNYDNQTYTKDNLPDNVKKNHIFDYKTQYVKEIRGLMGTLTQWDSSNSLKYNNHGNSAPIFESGSWFKIYTKGFNNIDISNWEDIVKIFTKYKIPVGTEVKIAFSTTSGDSWFYINNIKTTPSIAPMTLSQSDLNSKGNLVQDLNEFTSSFLLTNSFIFSQADKEVKTIDIVVALKTTKTHITPLMSHIWFDYNNIGEISAPIPIRPFNGEEFENEYVNFVWLQPEAKRGSIQNRIEISDVPSFEQLYKNINAVPTDTSSTNNKIHLPFSGSEYSDFLNLTKNMKLPYLKRRFSAVTVAGEERLPSLKWEDRKVKYVGTDIYFRKGNTVQLLSQPDLNAPVAKFTLENILIPREENLISNFKFYGLSNFSKSSIINDTKSNNVFDFNTSLIGADLTRNEVNTLHGSTPVFTGKNNNNILLNSLNTSNTLSALLSSTSRSCTFHFRFIATELVINQWNSITAITDSSNKYLNLLEIYPFMDNGNKIYRIRNYVGTTEQYADLTGFEEGAETTATIVFDGTSTLLYINGVLFSNNVRQLSSGDIKVDLGNRTQITLNAFSLNGHFLEMGIWDIGLNAQEIKEISKVSYWHLRYDFSDNKLRWYNVPYNEHIKHYKFIKDEVSILNQRINVNFRGTIQHFALGSNECYYNYHDSLLMGKYKPFRGTAIEFIIEDGLHRPMQCVPFLTKRTVTPVNNYKAIEYYDNNSINYKYATQEYYVNHGRYSHLNNYSLSFLYNNETANGYSNIILLRGAFGYTENGVNHPSMSLMLIQNGATLTFEVAYYNTGNGKGIVTSGALPFMLKNNTIYELELKSEEGFNNTKAFIKSNTDDNYIIGHLLGIITLAPTKGFDANNYNDQVVLTNNANFEECAFSFRTDNKSAFQIIDLNVYDVNSVKIKESGYLQKYEIFQNISKSVLKKLNTIKFGSYSNNPGADIRTFISFNGGVTYRTYNSTTNNWVAVSPDIPTNGMSVPDTMNLSSYSFNVTGGLTTPINDVVIRFVFFTNSPNSTIFLDKIDISYNGPLIIDSWRDFGTFYNGSQFYQSESGWSPYVEPDFNDLSQNWNTIGSDKPSPTKLTSTNGSKPSYAARKVFGGVRVLLNPKGKYYWRVASYNGI